MEEEEEHQKKLTRKKNCLTCNFVLESWNLLPNFLISKRWRQTATKSSNVYNQLMSAFFNNFPTKNSKKTLCFKLVIKKASALPKPYLKKSQQKIGFNWRIISWVVLIKMKVL
jgi:hypothetical protein